VRGLTIEIMNLESLFQTRDNNYAAIKDFFRKFPHFKHSPLFLFGQSYGGVYVPMLATKMVDDHELNFDVNEFIQFQIRV
jgi:carboxypeptidase C (cathepsin A)